MGRGLGPHPEIVAVAWPAEGAEQVVALQKLFAQAAIQGAAHEAGGHEEHADAAGNQSASRTRF